MGRIIHPDTDGHCMYQMETKCDRLVILRKGFELNGFIYGTNVLVYLLMT